MERSSPHWLPADIAARIDADFSDPEENALVRSVLNELSTEYSSRIVRCVVHCAQGSLAKFGVMEEMARTDYRDVVASAEYAYPSWQRLHDFDLPFDAQPELGKAGP